MISEIDNNRDAISRLCQKFGVRRLEVFGSAATGAFESARSDVDFVVDFDDQQVQGLFKRYFGFKEALEGLFGRPVDLVMPDAMKNPFFIASVNATRQPVYAAEIPKAA